jgi:catechol 2,3-dioxygenase-like lactoylglutathione lyase family enzyme
MSLAAAVIFVSDLERSRRFYRELLALDAELETENAVLLAAHDGSHVVLRSLEHAIRGTGVLGVQSLIWSVDTQQEFERCQEVLSAWNSLVTTREGQGLTTVQGRDPDRLPILVTFRCGLAELTKEFPTRVFAYY